jgi:hypothetical protein
MSSQEENLLVEERTYVAGCCCHTLSKGLTKQDHIFIMGGSGNSLDRNHYYAVEKDVNFIAERTANTNVGLVNLFRRHDKPWMNERVRRVNVWLDRAPMVQVQVQVILLYKCHIIQTKRSHKVVISYKYSHPLHTVDKL